MTRDQNILCIYINMAVCQNLVPLVNIKIAGKWMFIPLKMVLIGIDPYPNNNSTILPSFFRGLSLNSVTSTTQRSAARPVVPKPVSSRRRSCHGNSEEPTPLGYFLLGIQETSLRTLVFTSKQLVD